MFRVPSDNFASCRLADFHWCRTIAKARTVPSYVAQPNPDIARPYANLALLIYQETNSLLTIKEIDPLDLAELFGTVGGFWGEDAGRINRVLEGSTMQDRSASRGDEKGMAADYCIANLATWSHRELFLRHVFVSNRLIHLCSEGNLIPYMHEKHIPPTVLRCTYDVSAKHRQP